MKINHDDAAKRFNGEQTKLHEIQPRHQRPKSVANARTHKIEIIQSSPKGIPPVNAALRY